MRNERPDGLVEFDFSLGDPDLSVDLILPKAAYDSLITISFRIRHTLHTLRSNETSYTTNTRHYVSFTRYRTQATRTRKSKKRKQKIKKKKKNKKKTKNKKKEKKKSFP